MTDLMIAGILVIIIGGAAFYIIRERKNGTKCIGCPSASSCPRKKDLS